MAAEDVQLTGLEVIGQDNPAVLGTTTPRGAIARGVPSDRAGEA